MNANMEKEHPHRRGPRRQQNTESVGIRADPKHLRNKQGTALHACNPSSGKAERGIPKACWPISLVKLVRYRFRKRLSQAYGGQ